MMNRMFGTFWKHRMVLFNVSCFVDVISISIPKFWMSHPESRPASASEARSMWSHPVRCRFHSDLRFFHAMKYHEVCQTSNFWHGFDALKFPLGISIGEGWWRMVKDGEGWWRMVKDPWSLVVHIRASPQWLCWLVWPQITMVVRRPSPLQMARRSSVLASSF